MPIGAITRSAAFSSAPFGANSAAGNKVVIHAPANFAPADPFILCVFFHGWEISKGSRDAQIAAAAAQIQASGTNCLFVAPKFGPQSEVGGFSQTSAFSAFVLEIETVLPKILEQSGMTAEQAAQVGRDAARTARILLVAFSGGWKPLSATLQGLLVLDSQTGLGGETRCADRIVGIQLLDCIYGDMSSAAVIAWDSKRRDQATLISIYGKDTGSNAKVANRALLATLRPDQPLASQSQWATLPKPLPGDFVAFFEVPTTHMSILPAGPPPQPVSTFLDFLVP